MANYIAFKLVKNDKLQKSMMYIYIISFTVFFIQLIIDVVFEIKVLPLIFILSFFPPIIFLITYIIYIYVNLIKMHGTIFLQKEMIKINIEKEQYGFSLFDTVVLSEYILDMETITQIEISYLGHASLIAKHRSYEKTDGHKNIINIQTKRGNEYKYTFFSDEKSDEKIIAAYVIFWKRNYNVEIKWGTQIIEEEKLDELEKYAYS